MQSKGFAPLALCLGTGLLLLLGSCGGSGSGAGVKDPVLMFVNACADGPVTFFANDEDKTGSLAYKAKTAFISVPVIDNTQGGYDISLEEPDRSVFYDNQAHVFESDTSTIILALGIKNPPSTELVKRLKETFFVPNRTAPIGNRARLIFVHAFNRKSPYQTPKLVLQTFGDQPLFQTANTDYGAVNELEVDSGTYKSDADPTKDTHWLAKDPDNDQVYAQNLNVTLDPAGIYIVLVSGVENANPLIKQSIQFLKIPALD